MPRTTALMVQIATGDPRPIVKQITDAVRLKIATGELPESAHIHGTDSAGLLGGGTLDDARACAHAHAQFETHNKKHGRRWPTAGHRSSTWIPRRDCCAAIANASSFVGRNG